MNNYQRTDGHDQLGSLGSGIQMDCPLVAVEECPPWTLPDYAPQEVLVVLLGTVGREIKERLINYGD